MKKIVLIILITFGLARQNAMAQEFEFESFIDDKKVTNMIVAGSSVAIEKQGTPKELYDNVLSWIKESYKNPEEVIVAQTDGKFIKITGTGIPLSTSYAMGGGSENRYIISFKFKDDRFKATINGVSYYGGNQYGHKWIIIGSLKYRKSNGKLHRDAEWFDILSGYFNELVSSVYSYKASGETEDDNW